MTTQAIGIVSADDHVTVPPTVWTDRLPSRYRDIGPRVVRERVATELEWPGEIIVNGEKPVDFWTYEDCYKQPLLLTENSVGFELDTLEQRPMRYDEIRKGCYDRDARLADMDLAGIEASVCFPNFFPRFAGQVFLEGKDKELALLCVQAYNDWMLDEWCGGSGGRLVPLGILPLWDVDLCVQETERVAPRGMRAFTFSEAPARLGLPSIPSGQWDPFFARCEEAQIVIAIHIGSAPSTQDASPDVSLAAHSTLLASTSAAALIDWLFAGVFERFGGLKLCLAESQIGWIPYFLERADQVWEVNRAFSGVKGILSRPPSQYFPDHVYCTFFDDNYGLANLEKVGVDNVLFEVDYPHADTNWPGSLDAVNKWSSQIPLPFRQKIMRDNARALFRLG